MKSFVYCRLLCAATLFIFCVYFFVRLSIPAYSCFFHSCIFQPCDLLLHFPTLQFRPYRIFHSCIFSRPIVAVGYFGNNDERIFVLWTSKNNSSMFDFRRQLSWTTHQLAAADCLERYKLPVVASTCGRTLRDNFVQIAKTSSYLVRQRTPATSISSPTNSAIANTITTNIPASKQKLRTCAIN